jgi:DNA mismatch repair protein MutS
VPKVVAAPQVSAVEERLQTIDPDELSAREALEMLYELKKISLQQTN